MVTFVSGFGTNIALFGRIVVLLLAMLERLIYGSVCAKSALHSASRLSHACAAGGLSHGEISPKHCKHCCMPYSEDVPR